MKTQEMKRCIDLCLECHRICLETASDHCLEMGGKHVEPTHFRLMMACAEICRSSAAMMMIGVEQHKSTCAACADICGTCADSCEQIGDMDACMHACRRCAESCRSMAA